jgi:hypothetical protein
MVLTHVYLTLPSQAADDMINANERIRIAKQFEGKIWFTG